MSCPATARADGDDDLARMLLFAEITQRRRYFIEAIGPIDDGNELTGFGKPLQFIQALVGPCRYKRQAFPVVRK